MKNNLQYFPDDLSPVNRENIVTLTDNRGRLHGTANVMMNKF